MLFNLRNLHSSCFFSERKVIEDCVSLKVRAREALSHTPDIVMCVAYYNPRVRKTAQWVSVLWHKPDDLMT